MIYNQDKFGFKFRDWDIYKDSRQFRVDVIKLVKKFPSEERFALSDQTNRALNSIILNIAEGSSKNSDKDTRVYINRSQGSLNEVISCLDCALDSKYITTAELEEILEKASSLAKRLQGFNKYLSQIKVIDHRSNKGFTLIELLTVMLITAMIATMTLANYRHGEKSRRVAIASDGIVSALTQAQNYVLAGKSTTNADVNCRVPKSYFITFTYNPVYSIRALNNCAGTDTIQSFTLPDNTRIKVNGLILDAGIVNNSLKIIFTSPFGQIKANKDNGSDISFIASFITIESTDGSISKTITVDGIAGKIQQ